MIKKPRIIFFDIETTPLEVRKFQYDRNPFINPNTIKKDWYIICAAWQVLGESKVNYVAIDKLGDDKNVVQKLRDVLATADIIGGHNIDKFDMRCLLARMIFHRIEPLPHIPTVDTKKLFKKIGGFSSNALDYLSKYLGGEGKIHVDYRLWDRVMDGSKMALREMVAYNKVDVKKNVEIYETIVPYVPNHPHLGVLHGLSRNHSCPNCGSNHLKRNGIRPTRAGILKQEVQCKDCGAYHRIPIEK